MKILVIGCNGFLGRHISDFFHASGNEMYGCDTADISAHYIHYFKTNQENEGLDVFLERQHVDVCINAAGSGNVGYSIQNPLADFGSNTSSVFRILNLLRAHKPDCKYLHISSAAVYGNPTSLPIKEKDLCVPISPYGFHKWMSEIICKEYSQIFNLHIAIIRPFSVYGEGQRKLLLWDVCNKLKDADEIDLYGTGHESRDFIHVHDLAKLLSCIIESGTFSCEIYNAASGNETTIREIADIFSACYGGIKKISFSGQVRTGDPINWRADMTAAKAIGYSPSIDIREGLERFVKWYKGL